MDGCLDPGNVYREAMMRLQKNILIALFILATINSCLKLNAPTSIRLSTPISPYQDKTITPIVKLSQIGHNTPLQIKPTTTISTPKPSQNSNINITPYIISTLSKESAQTRLYDLLVHNGNCDLPCLWGIKPGFSSSNDAMSILIPLRVIAGIKSFSPQIGTINPRLTLQGGLNINISVIYISNNNVVNQIAFGGQVFQDRDEGQGLDSVFNSTVFSEKLSYYMLSNILSEFGRPSSVMITTLAQPPTPSRGGDIGYFRIILLYPEQGISIRYITNIKNIGENVVGCLANAHVDMELYSSGNGKEFMNNLDPAWKEDINNNYKPLEEVTSMSIDDFYQIFRQPTDKCIETPASLWPIPEK